MAAGPRRRAITDFDPWTHKGLGEGSYAIQTRRYKEHLAKAHAVPDVILGNAGLSQLQRWHREDPNPHRTP